MRTTFDLKQFDKNRYELVQNGISTTVTTTEIEKVYNDRVPDTKLIDHYTNITYVFTDYYNDYPHGYQFLGNNDLDTMGSALLEWEALYDDDDIPFDIFAYLMNKYINASTTPEWICFDPSEYEIEVLLTPDSAVEIFNDPILKDILNREYSYFPTTYSNIGYLFTDDFEYE